MKTYTKAIKMASLFTVMTFVLSVQFAFSQILFNETFDYEIGSLLSANGWTAHSGVGNNSPAVVSGALSLTGYGVSGVGNSTNLLNTGEDVHRMYKGVDEGTVYAAFLVNVAAAGTGGDYFFHLGTNPLGFAFYNRTFVKTDAEGNVAFGIQKTSGAGTTQVYTPFDYALNTTYLMIVAYEFVDGGDDVAKIAVVSDLTTLPTTWDAENSVGTDIANISAVALRQGAAASGIDLQISGIRVGTDMEAVITGDGAADPVPVTVTFRVNTSTVTDTLKTTDDVFIRGAFKVGDGGFQEGDYNGQNISWGTTLPMTNVGGDNWELDVTINSGDAVQWKYFPQFSDGTGLAIFDGGWEAGDPRLVSVPASQLDDMTLDLGYWNNGNTPPYTVEEDSVTLYFRVNVGAFVQDSQFDPATDKVGLRGNPEVFQNPGDWSSTAIYLTQEGRTDNSGDNWFYSGVARVADADVANFTDPVPYKFVLETGAGVVWDDNAGANDGNRFVTIPAEDATIPWVYMQNKKPTDAEIVTLTANFQVNVAILEGLGFFDSGVGDKVVTRGETPLDWGTNEGNTMIFDDEDVVYRLSRELTRMVGSSMKYKYYIDYDESRTDPESPNFIQAIADNVDFGYEEPVTTGGADRLFGFTNETVQTTGPQFYNGVPYAGIIFGENTPDGSLEVTFRVDMTAALTHTTPFNPANDKVYIQFESKYTALTQGFASGGGLFDDAETDEEVEFLRMTPEEDGSNIYAITFDLEFPTINDFGFVVRYGSVTGEEPMVVNGGGFDAGRRYYQFIEPTSVDETEFDPFFGQTYDVQWPATYAMALLEWKSNNLPFDVQPDYAALSVSVDDRITEAPNSFKLEQNYPNPFNPSTNINFTLPTASDVTLTVYNVLGQRVATLVNGRMNSGAHGVRFDASNLASGIYFYRLQTNNFVQQRSMTLIK